VTIARTGLRLAAILACAWPAITAAQDTTRTESSRWIHAASDEENYLRYLQTLQQVPGHPWSVRAFSARELRALRPTAPHPWSGSPRLEVAAPRRRMRLDVAPVQLQTWYNTAFPFGMNDGAVWVGRGLTGSITAGASVEWGPLELTVAPTAFWSENRAFPLMPVRPDFSPYADGVYPTGVDRPQRFGAGPYARGDAGESSLRVNVLGVSAGISNQRPWWGPMSDFPLILGNNAPGFGHAFIGSEKPFDVYVGRAHARVLYARLEQSAFSPETTSLGRRFAGGFVGVFQPRGFPGLEVGATRFYHIAWPTGGLTSQYFTHLFESFLKNRVRPFNPTQDQARSSIDNQLASVFARWVLPRSGFELYGEYGREDHNANETDLLLEPDHAAAFGVGARKAWTAADRMTAVRAEIVDFRTSSLHRHRPGEAWYRHEYSRQGHTHRGQLLATAIGVGGGAGATAVVERYNRAGMDRLSYSRLGIRDRPITPNGVATQHVVRAERRTSSRWRHAEVQGAVDVVYDITVNGADRVNARFALSAIVFPGRTGTRGTPAP
jgi:hypothetical protein